MITKIIIDNNLFRQWFPELKGIQDEILENLKPNIGSYISTTLGNINLTKNLQIRGNYLALAHLVTLQVNPPSGYGKITSASQGSESASFSQGPVKNWFDYFLSLTPYGIELLGILALVQPPILKKPLHKNYYNKYYY